MIKKIVEAFREGYQSKRQNPRPLRADGKPVHVETFAATKHRQSVAATIIRACPHCTAPGTWTFSQEALDKWPRVWVNMASNARGWPVGPICPNCSLPRNDDEVLGEIWVKEHG